VCHEQLEIDMAVDVQGKQFEVGQKVARAIAGAKGIAWVEVQICTKVNGDKVYLADSTRPMNYPERLCIIS
jgi:hypothetical protein